MTDKLYKVGVAGSIYVLANNDEEAVEGAVRSLYHHDTEECGLTIMDPELVKAGHRVPETWKTGLPFSKHSPEVEKTVQELVDEMGSAKFKVTMTVNAYLQASGGDAAKQRVMQSLEGLEDVVSSMEVTAHAEEEQE